MNGAVSALRFFFMTTCNRPEMARHLRLVKQPQKLPVVLTTEEVLLLLEAAPGPKYKAALGVAYGAGLRVSEVANLKVSDIDSERMVLRVEQGKGRRTATACCRRGCWSCCRSGGCVGQPTTWLFPGRDPLLPITTRQLYRVVRDTADAVGDREAGVATYAAAQLRDASSGARGRHSRDPGGSGTFQARYDGALCARREQGSARHGEPARSAHASRRPRRARRQ